MAKALGDEGDEGDEEDEGERTITQSPTWVKSLLEHGGRSLPQSGVK
ncbi:hypothetical protein H6G04_18245 [Calothrix membranacea FACHB-236]|nr:hypothetical protein [Calothrix membranacea FACHB-236]